MSTRPGPSSLRDPEVLQAQARALGDPTRHRIFRFVVEARRPVGVAELTELVGLNHNAVRQHLATLCEAGLLEREQAPSVGRGRPRLQYRPRPDADGRWGTVGPYERLSLLLAEMVTSGDRAEEVGRRSVVEEGTSRRDAGPVSVVPPSPLNTSSLSSFRYQRASDDCTFGRASVRTPSSAPVLRTSGVAESTGSPDFGSTLIVTPRASLLWKPVPALTKYSVLYQGPNTNDAFGEAMPDATFPEFSGVLESTLKRYQS